MRYSGRDGQTGVSRMEGLRRLASGDAVFACPIDGLEDLMKGLRTR